MIVFGTYFNFFIVLPIRLKTSISNGFLQSKMCTPEKSGSSQRFCSPERVRLSSGAHFVQVCYSILKSLKGLTADLILRLLFHSFSTYYRFKLKVH